MPKHVVDLLTNLGLPAEDAAKIDALPEAEQATFDTKPYAEKVKTNYQTQFQNDPAFFNEITVEKLPPAVKKQLESGQYARATNVSKTAIAKALGFNSEEIKDLEADDFKALDKYVPAIIEKYTKTKSSDKELQQQLIEARKQAEKYGPDYEKGIETKYQTESEKKIAGAIFNANVIGELSSIPKLKINAGDISKTAADILLSKYGYAKVGDFSIELRQKDNHEMKVLKEGSSQILPLREALIEIATERGWIDKEAEGGTGGGKVEIKPEKGVLTMVAPHLQDKISQKIASEGK